MIDLYRIAGHKPRGRHIFRKMVQRVLDVEGRKDRSGIQVIARAAAILRALRDARGGQSLGQIANAVSLPRSTVQRIVAALAEEGLVLQGARGGIRLGPEMRRFAERTSADVVDLCRPFLTAVTEATGETTDLAVLRDGQMVFLDQAPGLHRLRAVSSVGEIFPLTTTANGRACLALMAPETAARLIAREVPSRAAAAQIQAKLDTIRVAGLAYDLDEHSAGISAIGFGFQDWDGFYYALSVPVPSARFSGAQDAIETALRDVKPRIEALFQGI